MNLEIPHINATKAAANTNGDIIKTNMNNSALSIINMPTS
jgi:hypothetical protein